MAAVGGATAKQTEQADPGTLDQLQALEGAAKRQGRNDVAPHVSTGGGTGTDPSLHSDPSRERDGVARPDPEMARYEAALAEWEKKKTESEQVAAFNAPLQKDIATLEQQKHFLEILFRQGGIDEVLTPDELAGLARSNDPELRAAAQWLLGHTEVLDKLPKKGTLFGGEGGGLGGTGIDCRGTGVLGELARQIEEKRAQLRPEVVVPPEPQIPGKAASGAASSGSAATPQGGLPLPPFTSTNTGGARTADALGYIQQNIEKLDEEITAANTAGDTAKASSLQAQKAKMMLCLQSMMELQKQQFEMMSNLSRMFSDMAKTAINNIR